MIQKHYKICPKQQACFLFKILASHRNSQRLLYFNKLLPSLELLLPSVLQAILLCGLVWASFAHLVYQTVFCALLSRLSSLWALILHSHSHGHVLTTPSLRASSLDQRLSPYLEREKNRDKTRLFVFCCLPSVFHYLNPQKKVTDTHPYLLFPTCFFLRTIKTFPHSFLHCHPYVIHLNLVTIKDFDKF